MTARLDQLRSVPEPLPGESIQAYHARLQAHIGEVIEVVGAEHEHAGVPLPDWIASLMALRSPR